MPRQTKKQAKGKTAKSRATQPRGQYDPISVPSAMSLGSVYRAPHIRGGSDGMVTIAHCEQVQVLFGSGIDPLFNSLASFFLNPGYPRAFPWLASIANNYETYEFKKLRFTFATSQPTSKAGAIFMAVDYDALDDDPPDTAALMANQDSVRAPIWSNVQLDCSLRNLSKIRNRYTRKGVHSVADQKSYDVGKLVIAASATGNDIMGDLYVDYEVELRTPQLRSSAEDSSAKIVTNGGTLPTAPFGTAPQVTGGLNLSVKDSHTLLVKEPGDYLLNVRADGTVLTGAAETFTAGNILNSMIKLNNLVNGAQTGYDGNFLLKSRFPDSEFVLSAIPAATITGLAARIAPYYYSLA